MRPGNNINRDGPITEFGPPEVQTPAGRFYNWLNKLSISQHKSPNGHNPEFAAALATAKKSLQQKRRNNNIHLQNARYIVFDTETTGFRASRGDEIINIAAVVVENGQIREDLVFDELVNPYRSIPDEIQELTGITDEMVANKRGICSVLTDLLDFFGDSVLVAHCAEFDLSFINKYKNWYIQKVIYNPVVDTYFLSKALCPELTYHDLDSLIENHCIPMRSRHTALGDSLMTAEVFLKFLRHLEEKDISTLKELYYLLQAKNNTHFYT